mgnify:CR=1 FL=1
MNLFICLFLPSVVGVKFMDILLKKMENKDIILFYFMNVLLSNYCVTFILRLINDFTLSVDDELVKSCTFSLKYITISLVLNVIISFVESLIMKNFNMSLEVKHGKKRK